MRSGLSRAANMRDAEALIAEAAAAGATLIATPEMTNVVDRKPRRLFEDLPFEADLEEVPFFAAIAKKHGVHLLIGSMAFAIDKTFGERKAANRAYLFGPDGATLATYDKLHMFDVDLPNGESWKESSIYAAGEEAVGVQAGAAKLGLTICYDVRFPHLHRTLAQAGAQILAVPAAFTKQTGHAHWEVLLRARAIETGSFVIAPAQGGVHEDGRETWGHSMIINPWGEVIAVKDDDEPGIITAEIDLAEVATARQQIPNLTLEKPFKINDI
jgi:predicted amidohydrolase